MRSELYFIRRWHDHNTTRTDRAVARIRRMVVSQNWSSGEVAACGRRASESWPEDRYQEKGMT